MQIFNKEKKEERRRALNVSRPVCRTCIATPSVLQLVAQQQFGCRMRCGGDTLTTLLT